VAVTTDDPRIRRAEIHEQEVLLPSLEAWRDIARDGRLSRQPVLPLGGWVSAWLDRYSGHAAASLGLVPLRGRWVVLPLLCVGGRYYRVHFEDVACEHCGRQCGPSATPDITAYAGSGYSAERAWAEFDRLTVCSCPYCGDILRRRQTVWLGSPEV
jgi:hypothetical protein